MKYTVQIFGEMGGLLFNFFFIYLLITKKFNTIETVLLVSFIIVTFIIEIYLLSTWEKKDWKKAFSDIYII